MFLVIPTVMSACTEEGLLADADRHLNGFRCDVVQVITEYADDSHDEFFSCIDSPVRLQLDPEFEREHWDLLVSGHATLDIDRSLSEIDGGAPLEASEIAIAESFQPAASTDSSKFGESSVLVVRVDTPDSTHPTDEAEMSANVFGGPDDQVNLKSQIDGCSHGKKTIVPVDVPGHPPGVLTAAVDLIAADHDSGDLANAAAELARIQLGLDEPVESTYDHVMYMIPPGSKNPFTAWAYSGAARSVYNVERSSFPRTQAHEIGHNMGLGHSGLGEDKYADKSGNMGGCNGDDDHDEATKKCFNAARSSQLGWYADKEVTIEAGTIGEYELVGVEDYPRASESQQVLLQLVAPDGSRVLHVAYNAGHGPNEGTHHTGERVTVVDQKLPIGAPSYRLAALTEDSEPFVIESFAGSGQTVAIKVLERTIGGQEVDSARLRVTYTGDDDGCEDFCRAGQDQTCACMLLLCSEQGMCCDYDVGCPRW